MTASPITQNESWEFMWRYIAKRLLMLIPVLLAVAFVIYAIMNVAEGDPVYSVAGADATEEQLEALREGPLKEDP